MSENTEITVSNINVDQILADLGEIARLKSTIMKEDEDYGVIPGTSKPTLLKPGAEKLLNAFMYWSEPEPIESILHLGDDGTEPFIMYRYKVTIRTRGTNTEVGAGIGSCNSREVKYRFRNAKAVCPDCGEELRISKQDKGMYYCWTKTGGCGLNVRRDDPRIPPPGKIANPDIYDQINTIDKMAQKRALIAAVLVATGASSYFTQDIEDMVQFNDEIVEAQYEEVAPTPAPKKLHWMETDEGRARFESWMHTTGLTDADVNDALRSAGKTADYTLWRGGKQELIDIVDKEPEKETE